MQSPTLASNVVTTVRSISQLQLSPLHDGWLSANPHLAGPCPTRAPKISPVEDVKQWQWWVLVWSLCFVFSISEKTTATGVTLIAITISGALWGGSSHQCLLSFRVTETLGSGSYLRAMLPLFLHFSWRSQVPENTHAEIIFLPAHNMLMLISSQVAGVLVSDLVHLIMISIWSASSSEIAHILNFSSPPQHIPHLSQILEMMLE